MHQQDQLLVMKDTKRGSRLLRVCFKIMDVHFVG